MAQRPSIHLLRHGQALHNVDRNYPSRDPPLTKNGIEHAKSIRPPFIPDLILISPMTRALQTAILAFPDLIGTSHPEIEVQIWPELREAHDAPFNKGVGRAEISEKFPQFDFSSCPEEWDHAPHSTVTATVRAEGVRLRLKELAEKYRDILVISHRGFLAFMVQGSRFQVCEHRSYQFADDNEAQKGRMGVHCETSEPRDFGPTVLAPRLG